MKKFSHHKGAQDVKRDATKAGLDVCTEKYDHGWDHIRVEGIVEKRKITLLYSVVNGRFFGYVDGSPFSSDLELDGQPWFDALLNLFYVAA